MFWFSEQHTHTHHKPYSFESDYQTSGTTRPTHTKDTNDAIPYNNLHFLMHVLNVECIDYNALVQTLYILTYSRTFIVTTMTMFQSLKFKRDEVEEIFFSFFFFLRKPFSNAFSLNSVCEWLTRVL